MNSNQNSTRRSYAQFCGVAKALDVVGERWTLLIVRDLLLGGRRWSDLLESLPGITTNLLSLRLERMVADGLVQTRRLPAPARATVYELTEDGRALEPVVLALGGFGERFLRAPTRDERRDPRWAMLRLKRRYVGSTRALLVGLAIGELGFAVAIGDGGVQVQDGLPTRADLVLRADFATLASWWIGGVSARALVGEGRLQREGSAADLAAFARAFALPP